MKLTCATFAYPRLDSAQRSAVAASVGAIDLPGVLMMATCLRIEVIAPLDPGSLMDALELTGVDQPKPELSTGEEAALHLFRVAAGLESPVLGEKEILIQYRKAVADAMAADAVDSSLLKLLQSGIGAARRVRAILPPQPHDSMAAIAAGLVAAQDQVTIIGAGEMAAAVVRNLASRPNPPKITVLARHPELVGISGVDVWPIARLDEVISSHSYVVSATSASSRLLSEEHFAVLLQQRSDPLVIIDMALPPDFEPPPDSQVTHYDIDDLAEMAGFPPEADEASALIEELSAVAYRRYTSHDIIGPLIGKMVSDADSIVASTVARFGPKLTNAIDEAVLRQAAHTVARTLLAVPIAHLHDAGVEAAQTISHAFQVVDE